MRKWLAKIILFKIWGWKVVGSTHNDVPKKLFVIAPHTSNWDFPIGIMLNAIYDMGVGYMAKHTLFKPPFGWFFRATGGIPVDRTRKTNIIDNVIEIYDSRDRFCTSITPEGKRKKVDRIKKGFYHIAKGANIPIVYVIFAFDTMTITFLEPVMPKDTVEEEVERFHNIFKDQVGKIVEYSYGYPFDK